MNHNNAEKKEIELGEIKPVKPEEENTTVRRPDTFYSQNNVTEFFSHLDQYTMHVKSQDKLANSIPTGATCFGMAYILYSLSLCRVYELNTLVLANFILVGGIGQVTAGVFEFIKGRTFITSVYITYGFYCLTHFFMIAIGKYQFTVAEDDDSLASFNFFWFVISLCIVLLSFRSNAAFTIQLAFVARMYFILIIGYGIPSEGTQKAGGIFGVIAGVIAMYIGIGQMINEAYKKTVLPMFPYNDNNGIDNFDTHFELKHNNGGETSRPLK